MNDSEKIRWLKNMIYSPSSTSISAYKTACNEMLEDAEKYRWHDLRKDPDDLPSVNKNVMFATSDGCVQEGEWNKTCWIQYRWTTRRYIDEVISWREIEPFEEEPE